jgi:hypothetical protein
MNASKARQLSVEILSLMLTILSCPLLAKQSTGEDPNNYPGSWYRIALDANGRATSGDGHGYGAGTWYYYPETGWHRQWFYNQPFDAAGKGRLKYVVYVRAIDTAGPTTLEINVNWTTPQWSQLNAKQPPLPQDAPTAREEIQYMLGRGLYRVDNQPLRPEAPTFTFTVDQYSPEWVSVDVRGQNAYVYGAVIRENTSVPAAIAARLEPQLTSGKGGLKWSQPPQQFDPATPFILNGWGEPSGLRQMAADDFNCEEDRPITGIQWSGSFGGWTQSALPQEVPSAFHVAIWTDLMTAPTGDGKSSSHPYKLVWETLCTHWTWSIAGYHSDPRQISDDTCFQFTCLLSQDEWFQPQLAVADGRSVPTLYWISITALYDPNVPAPPHPWAWTTRPHFFGGGAVQITGTEPADPRDISWPPGLGSRWLTGTPIEFPRATPWDLAFELLTTGTGGGRSPDLAPVYRFWSDTLGGHFYTIDETEKDTLMRESSHVWTFEGVAFYAYPPDRAPVGSKPVYRFWSDTRGRHFFSMNETEKQKLLDEPSQVWTFEGIAWYAFD